jgi:galactokinase/mevalonate kinase-like predicted kinase
MIPFRIELTGAYMENNAINRYHDGGVVVLQIEADSSFHQRGGLSSSTQYIASIMWGDKFPSYMEPNEIACKLYMAELKSMTHASTSDACGIAYPGCTYLHYGNYASWPSYMDRVVDQESLHFLQDHIQLYFTHERSRDHKSFEHAKLDLRLAHAISVASTKCWYAIKNKDPVLLGEALNQDYTAHRDAFPNYETEQIKKIHDRLLPSVYGCGLTGAGGGGYLTICSNKPIEGAIRITPGGLL